MNDVLSREACIQAVRCMLEGQLPDASWAWVDSSKAAKVSRYGNQQRSRYLKLFMPRSKWERMKTLLRGSRSQRAVEESLRLKRAGFNTPTIVDHGELGNICWMVTQGVPGIGLGIYLSHFLRRPVIKKQLTWKRSIIRSLGCLVGQLHEQGIVHGDLRLNNILINYLAHEPVYYLIDNERNRQFARKIPTKLIVKNLVQIHMIQAVDFTLTDRMRFFNSYFRHYKSLEKSEYRKLITATMQKMRERMGERFYSHELGTRAPTEPVKNLPYAQ